MLCPRAEPSVPAARVVHLRRSGGSHGIAALHELQHAFIIGHCELRQAFNVRAQRSAQRQRLEDVQHAQEMRVVLVVSSSKWRAFGASFQ